MQPNEMVDENPQGEEIDSSGSACGDNPKSSKPMMEKRRRARINNSLNELKTILLEALKKDTTRHSKLEKADILEMTVKYLRRLERQRVTAIKMNPAIVNKYKAGFSECRNEVMKFLSTHEGVAVDVRTRLLSHLETCQQSLQDEDQDFSCDEFAIQPMNWMTSPMQSDEQTSPSPKSPKTTSSAVSRNKDMHPAVDTNKEFRTEDHIPQTSSFAENEQQVLYNSMPTPPSSVEIASPPHGGFKEVAVIPHVRAESGLVPNVPHTSSNYLGPVVFQAVPANTIIPENPVSYRPVAATEQAPPIFSNTGRIVPITTASGNLNFAVGYLIPFTGNETNAQSVQVTSAETVISREEVMPCNMVTSTYTGTFNQDHIHPGNLSISRESSMQYTQTYEHGNSNFQNPKNPWRPWSHDNVT